MPSYDARNGVIYSTSLFTPTKKTATSCVQIIKQLKKLNKTAIIKERHSGQRVMVQTVIRGKNRIFFFFT